LLKISKASKCNLFVDVNGVMTQVVFNNDPEYFYKLDHIYKRIDYFYLESIEFIECIQESFWNILESFDQSNELTFNSNINHLKDAIYLCYELIHVLGINESIESLYKLIINKVISIVSPIDDYKGLLKHFKNNAEYNLEHALGISFLSVKTLEKFNTPKADVAFFILSVLLHDCGFKDSSISYFYDVRRDLAEINNIELDDTENDINELIAYVEKSPFNDEQLKSLLFSFPETRAMITILA
jgi:hypothetical protein